MLRSCTVSGARREAARQDLASRHPFCLQGRHHVDAPPPTPRLLPPTGPGPIHVRERRAIRGQTVLLKETARKTPPNSQRAGALTLIDGHFRWGRAGSEVVEESLCLGFRH